MLALVAAQEAADIASGHGLALPPVIGAGTLDGFAAGVLLSAGAFMLLMAQRSGLLNLRWAGATLQFASQALGRYPGEDTPERRWPGRPSGASLDAGEEPLLQPGVRLREWLQGDSAKTTATAVTVLDTPIAAHELDAAQATSEPDVTSGPTRLEESGADSELVAAGAGSELVAAAADSELVAATARDAVLAAVAELDWEFPGAATAPDPWDSRAERLVQALVDQQAAEDELAAAAKRASAAKPPPAAKSAAAAKPAARNTADNESAAAASDPASAAAPQPQQQPQPPQPADEPARHGRTAGYRSKHRRPAPERSAPERRATPERAPRDDETPEDAPAKDSEGTSTGLWPEKGPEKESRRRNPRHAAPMSRLASARRTIAGAVHFRLLGAHR